MQPDPGTVFWISGILVAAIGGAATWAWNHTHKRIDEKADKALGEVMKELASTLAKLNDRIDHEVRCVRAELRIKADTEEMNRQRVNIAELFKGQQKLNDDMHAGFTSIREQMTGATLTLTEKLNDMGTGRRKI